MKPGLVPCFNFKHLAKNQGNPRIWNPPKGLILQNQKFCHNERYVHEYLHLGDLAKYLHVAHCINDHNLDFFATSETGRRDFPQCMVDRLSGGADFEWTSQPPRGRSGGILLGLRSNTMEVLARSGGDNHIKLHIRNRVDNTWSLVTVYGPHKMNLMLTSFASWLI
jgi:hypothetical protein